MSDDRVIRPPWSDEQVEILKKYQSAHVMHPYTCPNRDGHPWDPEGDFGVLVPTRNGWVCRHCQYTQDWAWEGSLHPFSYEPWWMRDA